MEITDIGHDSSVVDKYFCLNIFLNFEYLGNLLFFFIGIPYNEVFRKDEEENVDGLMETIRWIGFYMFVCDIVINFNTAYY